MSRRAKNGNFIHNKVPLKSGEYQRRKKNKTPHKCVKCSASFFHMTKLVEHLKNTHGIENAFSCDECGKAFKSPMNIARHKLIHSGTKKFSCDVCEYTCNQKTNLETHKRRHAKDFLFKCSICKKGFISKADFAEHANVHTNFRFRCDACDKNYFYKRNLIAHLRLCHYEVEKKKDKSSFNCNECELAFTTLGTLRNHIRNRHRVKKRHQYLCDLCGANVSSKKALDIHTRTHTGERDVACDLCPKKFTTKENYKIHRRTHTGEKPYACHECGKHFTQRSSLVIHLRYHTGDRPYWCPDCGKGFVTNHFLKKHRKSHENSKVAPHFEEQPRRSKSK
ncbi:hypothetical protein KQX54_002788 [Cotesia glomerata]|uniref:C2H2-type domain-containing protein n=2 Tax=Cotesia glomerata TaxID=32391 RepID=A0AAV7J2A0_COTGL|nr:hypothetical protein KQX54_002788 [Cotesia glomerata]